VTLADAFRRGVNAHYDIGGVDATYTDRAGNTTTCRVIVDYDLSQYGDTFEVSKSVATVGVRVSEVAYPPRQGDQFVVGADTFVVDNTTRSDELEHTVLVS
jgi:hypothetical protein